MKDLLLNFLGFLLISICWGGTNPFLKRGMEGMDRIKTLHSGFFTIKYHEFMHLVKLQFILPLLVNLSGSLVFYHLLGTLDLTLVIPVVNGMSLLTTSLVARIMGEKSSRNELLGIAVLTLGIFILLLS
jgi:drug/metabolite transporter (DMT)-like permease